MQDGEFLLGRNLTVSQTKTLHAELSRASSSGLWKVEPLKDMWGDGTLTFVVTTFEERRRTRKPSKSTKKLNVASLDVLPTTTFTKHQLYNAAKLAGERLYADQEFVWGSKSHREAGFQEINTYRLIKEHAETLGEDARDVVMFVVPTFSYAFFPSRPGEGIDTAESMSLVLDWRRLVDSDGNVYLVDNTGRTEISVVLPTVKTRAVYDVVVEAVLKEGT